MKKPKSLTRKMTKQIDLDYILRLSEEEQRAAVFYEYARESVPVCKLVEELRNEPPPPPGIWKLKLSEHLHPKVAAGVFTESELSLLARNPNFPSKPFNCDSKGIELVRAEVNPFGIVAPRRVPWEIVDYHRAYFREQGLDDVDAIKAAGYQVIALPYATFSNDELIKLLAKYVPAWRPKDCPEPKRSGRKGRHTRTGLRDLLKQLKAYRLQRAGYDCSAMRWQYSSRGWEKAVRSAERRINEMMDRSFFLSARKSG